MPLRSEAMAGLRTALTRGSGDWEANVWPGRQARRDREGTEQGGALRGALGTGLLEIRSTSSLLSTCSWASVLFCFNSKVDVPHTGIRATLFSAYMLICLSQVAQW